MTRDPSPKAAAIDGLFSAFEIAQQTAMAAMVDADELAETFEADLTDRQRRYIADIRERAERAVEALRY